jgi:hypothetical protein
MVITVAVPLMAECPRIEAGQPNRGGLSAGRAFDAGRQFGAAEIVRRLQIGSDPSFANVRLCASALDGFYRLRIHRQGRWTAYGSVVTATGALVSSFAKGQTRQSWALIGFAPVLANQFEGYSTTEQLFVVGSESLRLLVAKYNSEAESRDQVVVLATQLNPTKLPDRIRASCNELDRFRTELRGWPEGEDRTVFEAEANKMAASCSSLFAVSSQLTALVPNDTDTSRQLSNTMVGNFRADILTLNEDLMRRDARTRLRPSETLSNFLTAVPNAVSDLLSSESRKNALIAVKQAEVIGGYSVRYSGLNQIPTLLDLPAELDIVGSPAASRIRSLRDEKSAVKLADVSASISRLVAFRNELNTHRFALSPLHASTRGWLASATTKTWRLAPAQVEPQSTLLQLAP